MPNVIDYPLVLDGLLGRGLRSLYYNSGAFGFAADAAVTHRGWVLGPDPTIRPAAMAVARTVEPPTAAALAERLGAVVGGAWLLPKSHWSYELDFGSRAWMPDALRAAGVESATLAGRNTGDAIAFAAAERPLLVTLVETLLTHLDGSDFQLVTLDRPAVCTVHHHQQLWWTTTDPSFAAELDAAVPA